MNPWRKRRRRKLYRAQYVARRTIAGIHKKWTNALYVRGFERMRPEIATDESRVLLARMVGIDEATSFGRNEVFARILRAAWAPTARFTTGASESPSDP